MSITKRVCATIAAVAAMSLAACGASETVTETTSTASGEGRTSYPLTIENCGQSVTFDKAPERTVSLDQGSTEILLSLGLEDKVVGTASWTDPILPSLEEANAEVPRLADNAPTYEVVMGTDPDFVTASFARHYKTEGGVASRERFAETNINTFLSPTDCEGSKTINGGGTRSVALTEDKVYEEISTLAEIFDVQSRGEELISELKSRADAATKDINGSGQTVAYWFADTNTPYVAGGLGSAAILSNKMGLKNVFADTADDWPAVGWETVVEKNPQNLVLGDLLRDRFPGDRLDDKEEFLASDPLTSTMDAVKNERYIALHGAEMNPSIRFVDGLEKISAYLKEHPQN